MVGEKLICQNKKAYHEYFIDEKFEAGIVLQGTEVKSLRDGKVVLSDAFMLVRDGEAFLHNLHISAYKFGNQQNHLPDQQRKLLLHKSEILRIYGQIREQGVTVVPLRLYFKHGRVKVELGLAKGKKLYDKREDLKKRDSQRELAQIHKTHNR